MNIREEKMYGECLEGVGIPKSGIVVIDMDEVPRVYDIVMCDDVCGSVYLKRLVRTGEHPIVSTCYLDHSRDFSMVPVKIYGVALKVLDENRNVVWERPNPIEYTEVRHAHWKHISHVAYEDSYRCSLCSYTVSPDIDITNYCPNCGSRMDMEEQRC